VAVDLAATTDAGGRAVSEPAPTTAPTPPAETPPSADTGTSSAAAGTEILPLLPLRDALVFPGTIQALSIDRASSLRLL
jgi:hypothetical protein